MLFEATLLVYCAAVGFCAAAVASNFYQLVTSRTVAFAMPSGKIMASVAAGASFALVGPYIVARNALRSRFVDRRSGKILAGGILVAAVWSACSGIVVLDLALGLRHSLS